MDSTMKDTNNYWYEIDFRLPAEHVEFCKNICMEFVSATKEDYVSTVTGARKSYGLESYQSFFFKEATVDYSEHPMFKELASLFKYTKKHWNYKYVFERSHVSKIIGSLKPHVDFRSCVFSLPVHNVLYPIHWYDNEQDQNMLATYNYNGMVLINTSEVHGCPENDVDRIIFQIGGFGADEPFANVRDAIATRLAELKEGNSNV